MICFHALPQSTYVEREHKKKQRGLKTAKDRVTVLVTCNMNGDKEKLLLIGKFKSPRCLRRVGTLPISYAYSKNAWMTATIFGDWLTSWDVLMQREGRKVAFWWITAQLTKRLRHCKTSCCIFFHRIQHQFCNPATWVSSGQWKAITGMSVPEACRHLRWYHWNWASGSDCGETHQPVGGHAHDQRSLG